MGSLPSVDALVTRFVRILEIVMKPIVPMFVSLFLFSVTLAEAQQTGAAASPMITITRRGAQSVSSIQPSRPSDAGPSSSNFTGSVRVQPVFQAIAPGRTNGSDVIF